jgi:hypothetical protein
MKIVRLFVLLNIILGILSCNNYSNRPIQFDKKIWNSSNEIMCDKRRYNMAIWFFNEYWFNEKTKEIILDELKQQYSINLTDLIYFHYNENGIYNENIEGENILLFDLRHSNGFMDRRDMDYAFKPIAYLKIYFNENDNVIKAELYEGNRNIDVKEYKIIKYWEIK